MTNDASKLEVMRAQEEWQRAGAYSVRIEGMNRAWHIPLREEFDGHDCDGTRYIVLLDDGYPVATCRFYDTAPGTVTLGRVVVLPEYRGIGAGSRVLAEAEKWLSETGCQRIEIDSRVNAVGFYSKNGYVLEGGEVSTGGTFECVKMSKQLK